MRVGSVTSFHMKPYLVGSHICSNV